MIYMYKWKASKLFNRRKITPPHGCVGIQNEVSNKLRKENICILAFRWKRFTIIAQLCFSRRQHPNSPRISSRRAAQTEQLIHTTWMNWDNTTRLDLWRNLRRYFPKATLTCCFSAIRMLSLLSSVLFLPERNVMFSTTGTTCLHSPMNRVVCWKFYKFWWIWINNCSQ